MTTLVSIFVIALSSGDYISPPRHVKNEKEVRLARYREVMRMLTEQTNEPDPDYVKEHVAIVEKLESAFGNGCPELNAQIKLWVPSSGLLIAARTFQVDTEDQVVLCSCSLIQFRKAGEGIDPTKMKSIRNRVINLKFKGPIKTISDIGRTSIREITIGDGAGPVFK